MDKLAGSLVVLTGASKGLGRVIARRLAAERMDLALVARSARALEDLAAELQTLGVRAVPFSCDLGDRDARAGLMGRLEAELGPVAVLVNNAGVELGSPFESMPLAEIEQTLELNLSAPLQLIREVIPLFLERGRGHVVNVASAAGKSGTPFEVAYSASKFGLVGATQALRAEYRGSPIGFSAVCPGYVADDGMFARMEEQGAKAPFLLGTVPPARVAEAVVDAIEHDHAELLVNGTPLRPALALSALFPGLNEWVHHVSGNTAMLRQAGQARRRT